MGGLGERAKRARILLVEDDPGDQELTRRALSREGIRADLQVARDAAEALRLLGRRGGELRPDLILLDLNLPGESGQRLLEQIGGRKELRGVPVVVVSTSAREADVAESYARGASSYLIKPLEARGYMRALEQIYHYWCELVAPPPRVP